MAPVNKTSTTKAACAALCIIFVVIMACALSAFGEEGTYYLSACFCTLHNLIVHDAHAADETLCDPVNGVCNIAECSTECIHKATKHKYKFSRVVCERHLTPQECCCTLFNHVPGRPVLTGYIGVVVPADNDDGVVG